MRTQPVIASILQFKTFSCFVKNLLCINRLSGRLVQIMHIPRRPRSTSCGAEPFAEYVGSTPVMTDRNT